MTGTVTVTTTSDWLTPFTVEVRADQGATRATGHFQAAAKAQAYALAKADELGYTLVYRDLREVRQSANDLEGSTNGDLPKTSVTTEDFAQRFKRICQGCREARPLVEFAPIYQRARTTGRNVLHGFESRCRECSA